MHLILTVSCIIYLKQILRGRSFVRVHVGLGIRACWSSSNQKWLIFVIQSKTLGLGTLSTCWKLLSKARFKVFIQSAAYKITSTIMLQIINEATSKSPNVDLSGALTRQAF